jgi:preprotein translocase subunit SecA
MMTENYSKRLELIQIRLKEHFLPSFSPAQLELGRNFNSQEQALIKQIKKDVGTLDFINWDYRSLISQPKENLKQNQEINEDDVQKLTFLIQKFTRWQQKENPSWQIFDEQIGALIRLIEAYKNPQKKGLILEMATSEGKSSVVIPIFAAYVGLLEDNVQIHTVTRYLANEDYQRFIQWGKELGIEEEVALLETVDIHDSQKREEKLRKRFVFGYQPDFVHCFENEFLERKNNWPKKLLILLDEIDLVLKDEGLTPAIIGPEISTNQFLDDLKREMKKFATDHGFFTDIDDPKKFADRLGRFSRDVFLLFDHWTTMEQDERKKELYRTLFELDDKELEKLRNRILDAYGYQSDYDKEANYFFDYPPFFNALLTTYSLQKGKDYSIVDNQIVPLSASTGYGEVQKRFNDLTELLLYFKENLPLPESLISSIPADSIRMFEFYQKMPRVFGFSGTAAPVARRLYEMFGVETKVNPNHFQSQRLENFHLLSDFNAKIDSAIKILQKDQKQRNSLIVVSSESEAIELKNRLLERDFRDADISLLTPQNQDQDRELFQWISQKDEAGKRKILIAARMIGRGIDIKPDAQVKNEGFLLISLTPFNFARSLRQLLGRVGRRGEVAEAHIFISADDPIFEIIELSKRKKIQNAIKDNDGRSFQDFAKVRELIQPVWERWENEAIRGVEVLKAFSAPIFWLREKIEKNELPKEIIDKLVGQEAEWGELVYFLTHTFFIQLPVRQQEQSWQARWFNETTRSVNLISDFIYWYHEKSEALKKSQKNDLQIGLERKYMKLISLPFSLWFVSYDKLKRYIENKLKAEYDQSIDATL